MKTKYTFQSTVDMPLLYFTDLIKNDLITKFSTENIPGFSRDTAVGKESYVCKNGTGSVVKHLLRDVPNITFNKRVASMSLTTDGRIKVVPEGQNDFDIFDVIVSTMPVPQLLQMENIDSILQSLGKVYIYANQLIYSRLTFVCL